MSKSSDKEGALRMADEIVELEAFAKLATSIHSNAKRTALLKALTVAFAKAHELGADVLD